LPERLTLSAAAAAAGGTTVVAGPKASFAPLSLERLSGFSSDRRALKGRRVAIATAEMAPALAAMCELDGLAQRMLLLPGGLAADLMSAIMDAAEIDAAVVDADQPIFNGAGRDAYAYQLNDLREAEPLSPPIATEWAMPTSGTSGKPKVAVHTLNTLTSAIKPTAGVAYATFYDIRRYGGLQIALRALLSGAFLAVSGAGETPSEFVARLTRLKVGYVSGTPSHWRRALMDASTPDFAPRFVRLSGEIADDRVLQGLRARFPSAEIAHAYASTEAGVGFVVDDGKAGFPAAFLDRNEAPELRIVDGTLRVRGPGAALRLLGEGAPALKDSEGFVDSGDLVERRGDRCLFLGRRGGVVNVGGQKVSPETIEAAVLAHPDVLACRASARRNPIMGAIVVVEIVARKGVAAGQDLERAILAAAGARLQPHEVPAMLKFVPELPLTDGGKLARDA